MWIDRLTYSHTTQAVELAAQFAEQRQNVLAENLAKIDLPGHPTRRLDPHAFQASLRDALETAREQRVRRLDLRGNAQFQTRPGGGLEVQPTEVPAHNTLFHDGTNARIELVLKDVAENALSYELATNLLRGRYEGLMKAIRGKTT